MVSERMYRVDKESFMAVGKASEDKMHLNVFIKSWK